MSSLLLDTHALLWWLSDDPALSAQARSQIADPSNEAIVSAASIWEIGIQRSLGRVTAAEDLLEAVAQGGFTWLAVTERHAWEVASLPAHHNDPFDRLLIAQALVEDLAIVTRDPAFAAYGVPVSW